MLWLIFKVFKSLQEVASVLFLNVTWRLRVPGYCSSPEPLTSPPRSVAVTYHLPFNLTEEISLKMCNRLCVRLFFLCSVCVRRAFFCIDDCVLPPPVITTAICWWNVKCNCYWSVFRHWDFKGFVVVWLRRLFRHDSQELFPWFALQDRNEPERRGQ